MLSESKRHNVKVACTERIPSPMIEDKRRLHKEGEKRDTATLIQSQRRRLILFHEQAQGLYMSSEYVLHSSLLLIWEFDHTKRLARQMGLVQDL